MSQIKVTNLTFSYEGVYDNIFDHVNFDIDTDWKLGFIGRNGRGKTTFLNLLLGKYLYAGQINCSVTFDYFPFEYKDEGQDTLTFMKSIIAPYDQWERQMESCLLEGTEESLTAYGDLLDIYTAHDGYHIDEQITIELGKLNVSSDILTRPFHQLSNGEQTKIMLAALFLKKNNFLLIDEPTNHLDSEGRKILAAYLNSKKSFILVSHDRYLLDHCVDHILSINQATIEIQKGNYSSWRHNKDLNDQFELNKNEKLKKDIVRLTNAAGRTAKWSDSIEDSKIGSHSPDRGYIGHMAAKMMKRSKAIEKRHLAAAEEKKELLKDIETAGALKINMLLHPKRIYLTADNLSLAFSDHVLFKDLSFSIQQGERVVIKGKNGSGKSSLIRILLGESLPFSGNISIPNDLKVSYVSQDTSGLKGSLKDFAKKHSLNESLLLSVLRQFDFPRKQFEKSMEHYSAGQKKKVLLAKSLIEPSHIYIWDEPLNYVDVLSRVQLEDLLQLFQPTMIFVEHDIVFTEKIATREIIL